MDLRIWFNLLRAASHREEGQTMAEYGVVLALITVAVVGVITALGLAITGKLGAVRTRSSTLNTGAISGPRWALDSFEGPPEFLRVSAKTTTSKRGT